MKIFFAKTKVIIKHLIIGLILSAINFYILTIGWRILENGVKIKLAA